MITSRIDMTGFNRGIVGLIKTLRVQPRVVIAKEAGELIKTLVKTSPAAKAPRIKDDIMRKFEWSGLDMNANLQGQKAGSGLTWVGVNGDYLTGIDPVLDMRDASVEELKDLAYQMTKRGRIKKPFIHPRKKQQVLILTKVLTKLSTVKKLAAAKAKNRGRLKASWLTAVRDGVIKISGGNMPPKWVTDHVNWGTRGYWRNGMNVPFSPSFTIASYAKGLTVKAERFFIQRALNIRAKAMLANMKHFAEGKKPLSSYAR